MQNQALGALIGAKTMQAALVLVAKHDLVGEVLSNRDAFTAAVQAAARAVSDAILEDEPLGELQDEMLDGKCSLAARYAVTAWAVAARTEVK